MRRRHVVIARYVSARINTTLSAQREHGGEIPRNTGWLSPAGSRHRPVSNRGHVTYRDDSDARVLLTMVTSNK